MKCSECNFMMTLVFNAITGCPVAFVCYECGTIKVLTVYDPP